MFRKLFVIVGVCVFFISCKKESETMDLMPIATYFPLEIGHFVEYDLDSTVFENFGQNTVLKKMQAKEIVQDTLRDGAGRLSYRIDRYIRINASESWQPSISYLVTPESTKIEVVENNLRYIKLVLPIKNDLHWDGNKYIDTKTIDQDLRFMADWDYQYDSVGVPLTIGTLTLDNTLKVAQQDETIGQDPSDPATSYAERTIGYEKYAKGVGLIEREFLHWEYQGAASGRPAYYTGFGIKMKATRHGKDN